MHGGGFVAGTAEMNEGFCKKMAKDLGAVVVSVDYRLATETAFPGLLEDCYSALLWMSREHKELGIDNNKLAITGESAGGSDSPGPRGRTRSGVSSDARSLLRADSATGIAIGQDVSDSGLRSYAGPARATSGGPAGKTLLAVTL